MQHYMFRRKALNHISQQQHCHTSRRPSGSNIINYTKQIREIHAEFVTVKYGNQSLSASQVTLTDSYPLMYTNIPRRRRNILTN